MKGWKLSPRDYWFEYGLYAAIVLLLLVLVFISNT